MASDQMRERLRGRADYYHAYSWVDWHTVRTGRQLENHYKELAIRYVAGYCERYTDRQMALHFPEIVKDAVSDSVWRKIRPEWAE